MKSKQNSQPSAKNPHLHKLFDSQDITILIIYVGVAIFQTNWLLASWFWHFRLTLLVFVSLVFCFIVSLHTRLARSCWYHISKLQDSVCAFLKWYGSWTFEKKSNLIIKEYITFENEASLWHHNRLATSGTWWPVPVNDNNSDI